MNVAPRPPRTSISVCSGVGGLDLGLTLACGVEPVVYIERDAFAASVLVARMEEKALAPAPLWDDVCTFDARAWRGMVDLVAGGTPCQDLSLAGQRAGLDGERSRIFFEHVRVAVECEAPLFFWENVAGATRAVPRVCEYLEARGYRGAWTIVRASDVGAPHERARIFLLAYAERYALRHESRWCSGENRPGPTGSGHDGQEHAMAHGREGERRGRLLDRERAPHGHHPDGRGGSAAVMADAQGVGWHEGRAEPAGLGGRHDVAQRDGAVAHPERQSLALGPRLGGDAREEQQAAERGGLPCFPPGPDDRDAWARVLFTRPNLAPALPADPKPNRHYRRKAALVVQTQPSLRGVADGVGGWMDPSLRADRLRACGNGVVPEQAAHAFRGLWHHLFCG